jgi:hypothetical protein
LPISFSEGALFAFDRDGGGLLSSARADCMPSIAEVASKLRRDIESEVIMKRLVVQADRNRAGRSLQCTFVLCQQ